MKYILWYSELGLTDVHRVGGKNASLGEMVRHLAHAGVRVPDGFATTAQAYQQFLQENGLTERIRTILARTDPSDVRALAATGAEIRELIVQAPFPPVLEAEIRQAYYTLAGDFAPAEGISWAVRSSATAEDLPEASFAGQQETFLNVSGIDNVLHSIKAIFASLYNDRAISYRAHTGFDEVEVALSAGVQKMVRSDIGAAGVMFTMDTESGFRDAVFITSSYGLGEAVVQGAVNPDEFYVYKDALRAGRPAVLKRELGDKAIEMVYAHTPDASPVVTREVSAARRAQFSLTDEEVQELARHALTIEAHYGRPMDIEWGKDGADGQLYILQARPETVQSRQTGQSLERFTLLAPGKVMAEGRAIGQRIGAGKVKKLSSLDQMSSFLPGDVLVTDMTDPDWEPIMKKASAIVTNRGGRTCHAAIIARELGIPAVVGTGDATDRLREDAPVTVSCAEGETGRAYEGILDYDHHTVAVASLPHPPVRMMMNVGTPEQAFSLSRLPNHGVGLARLEFIINRQIGIHPRAVIEADLPAEQRSGRLPVELVTEIEQRVAAYQGARDFYVRRLAEGVATIAAAFAPDPVIVRLSDFKSNEYANLLGGSCYEPHEENPMLGYRGASRYLDPDFHDSFALECAALRYVREQMGLTNIKLMVPFVRTLEEAAGVIALLEENGLRRGDNGLEIIMMCELPSNVLLAEEFLDYFDGFSIGSNDLTQLTLGLDRDSGLVSAGFDERNPAVKKLLTMAIRSAQDRGKYVGICGQGPSDFPDLAQWLVSLGIDSVSLNPDTVIATWTQITQGQPVAHPA
jgi:pyruvate,water dikinase